MSIGTQTVYMRNVCGPNVVNLLYRSRVSGFFHTFESGNPWQERTGPWRIRIGIGCSLSASGLSPVGVLVSPARILPAGQRSRFTLNLKLLAGRGVGTLLILSS